MGRPPGQPAGGEGRREREEEVARGASGYTRSSARSDSRARLAGSTGAEAASGEAETPPRPEELGARVLPASRERINLRCVLPGRPRPPPPGLEGDWALSGLGESPRTQELAWVVAGIWGKI